MNTTTRNPQVRRLASGAWAVVDETGRASIVADEEEAWGYLADLEEGPHCSLCDAVGHGSPGGGPCPLEERGFDDARRDEEMAR